MPHGHLSRDDTDVLDSTGSFDQQLKMHPEYSSETPCFFFRAVGHAPCHFSVAVGDAPCLFFKAVGDTPCLFFRALEGIVWADSEYALEGLDSSLDYTQTELDELREPWTMQRLSSHLHGMARLQEIVKSEQCMTRSVKRLDAS